LIGRRGPYPGACSRVFIRSEGFNTQEPAQQFAGELQGEVVDSAKSKKYKNEAVPKLQFLEQLLTPGENCLRSILYTVRNQQFSPGACFIGNEVSVPTGFWNKLERKMLYILHAAKEKIQSFYVTPDPETGELIPVLYFFGIKMLK
jgi:hypothetical protein